MPIMNALQRSAAAITTLLMLTACNEAAGPTGPGDNVPPPTLSALQA